MERGLDTNVRRMRHKVFKAIAELAYTSTNFADDMDAKMETFTELADRTTNKERQGYNRLFETNIRLTKGE